MSENRKTESIAEKKVSRRSMLKWTGALVAAAVTGAVAEYGASELLKPPPPPPLSLKPPLSQEIKDRVDTITKQLVDRHTGETTKYINCMGHGCHQICVIKARLKNGVVTALEPDDTINAGIAREDASLDIETIRKGMIQTRSCPVSYSWQYALYAPDRLTYPMKPVGNKGEGKWQRIQWEEALDMMATKWKEIKEKYGPLAFWHMPYSCSSVSSLLLGGYDGVGVAGWDCYSTNGTSQPAKWVLGGGSDHDIDSIAFNSKLIVLWGFNPSANIWGETSYILSLGKEREGGPKIIAIDPRYTTCAEVLADQFIAIRPSTDVAMILGMANVLFKEDLYDHEYVAKYVEPTGLEKWRNYVLGTTPDEDVQSPDDKVDHTPEWAEKICGVPAETIKALARLWVKSKPVALCCYGVLGRQMKGENNVRAFMYLQALTGNTSILGGTAYPTEPDRDLQIPAPKRYGFGRPKPTYYAPVRLETCKWSYAMYLRERYDNGEISMEEYNGQIGNVSFNLPPNFRMIFQEVGGPGGNPDINKSIIGLKGKDVFHVVLGKVLDDLPMMYADLALPSSYLPFESRDVARDMRYETLRSSTRLGNVVNYGQMCVPNPGEVRTKKWVYLELSKRLGVADKFEPELKDVPLSELDTAMEAIDKKVYEGWAALDGVKELNPPTWEDFLKSPVFRFERKSIYPYQAEIEAGKNPFSGTPSGKIEFYSDYIATGPENLAKTDYPKGSGICYGPGNLAPMAKWEPARKDHFYSPDVQKYPLLCSSAHSAFRVHSYQDQNPLINDQYRQALWINVADAKARGIKDGDLVRVYNDIGEMFISAYVTSTIMPGSVNLPWGGRYVRSGVKTELMPEGVDVRGAHNFITHVDDVPDTICGNLNCKGLVEVEKL